MLSFTESYSGLASKPPSWLSSRSFRHGKMFSLRSACDLCGLPELRLMKILHVISSVNPAGGGPIEGVKQLGTALTSMGHQVEVTSLDPPDAQNSVTATRHGSFLGCVPIEANMTSSLLTASGNTTASAPGALCAIRARLTLCLRTVCWTPGLRNDTR